MENIKITLQIRLRMVEKFKQFREIQIKKTSLPRGDLPVVELILEILEQLEQIGEMQKNITVDLKALA